MKYYIKFLYLFVFVLMSITCISCGGDEDNNIDEPENPEVEVPVITRVQDKDGMIFLQNGDLVEANTSFSTSLLSQALTETNWKRSYYILYDNNHVSNIIELEERYPYLPLKFLSDQTALFPNGNKRHYSLNGNVLTIAADLLSSTMAPLEKYNFVSVDYSDSKKRLVTDLRAAGFVVFPEGYDMKYSHIRIVWTND